MKVILWIRDSFCFQTLCSNKDVAYKQSLCSNDFFCSLPSELVCIISGKFILCDFKKFCKCVDHIFLVPNEAAWQSLERQQGIIVWSSSLYKEIYLQIDKYSSINFSCFEHVEFLRVISWFWIFFACSYLGASNFGCPPVFQM